MIENWLRNVLKETRAAERDYWCGEHGHYTNATAGYVGNNKLNGIESNSRYMKRNNAGCNKRISIRVFVPSLTQYISDNSKRQADKILLPTGAHRFPMLPTISTTLWGKVQKFDIMRLLLSATAGSINVQKQWLDELGYFHEVDAEGKMFTDVIKEFGEAGNRMHVTRSTLEAIIMPTDKMIKVLRYRFTGTEPTFEDYQEAIQLEATAFNCLFDSPDVFEIEYP
jgi:hypothetical protein